MKSTKRDRGKIAFLLSGSGSTLENLIEAINKKEVDAKIEIVISSKKNAFGLKRAESWNIPARVVEHSLYKNNKALYSDEITKIIDEYKATLIVFGGFLSYYKVPPKYKNKVLNVHPSLIPSFCGKGYYGLYVHQAVLDYGAKLTGCTVHFVDNEYDKGPIIAQEIVKVENEDTAISLQTKVMEKEKVIYPYIIQKAIENKIIITGRKVRVL